MEWEENETEKPMLPPKHSQWKVPSITRKLQYT